MKQPIAEKPGEGRLSRWSHRKLEAQAAVAMSEVELDASASVLSEESVQETQLTDADMPPVESLDAASDYSGFLSPKVSEALRQIALRKLFHGVAFNTPDGLDDYAEDFTSFAKLGDLVTSDMRFEQAMEEQRRQEQEQDTEMAEPGALTEPEVAETASADVAEEVRDGAEATIDDDIDESETEA